MQYYEYALIIGVGILAGFINVIAGGGSLISLPILIFLGLPSVIANATNRVAIFFQNVFAVAGFRSKGVSPLPYGTYLSLAAIPGSMVGAFASTKLEDAVFNKVIAVIMIAVIFVTVLSPKISSNSEERMGFKHQLIGTVVFFFVGMYGGFIQAGIGFIIIASLVNINHLSLVKTNAIKVFVALVYTAAALGVFIWKGMINWEYGLSLAVGNATGAWVASRWSVKAGDKWIKRILVIAVTALAIKLWFYS
ncbi:MAG: sulfite exporter TauE/SafE family protein [Cyclobacteriaceae bacterium]|nr:sulfite exporter TauE/SafE family protein [Cyclobacteriaceae bacterium]